MIGSVLSPTLETGKNVKIKMQSLCSREATFQWGRWRRKDEVWLQIPLSTRAGQKREMGSRENLSVRKGWPWEPSQKR